MDGNIHVIIILLQKMCPNTVVVEGGGAAWGWVWGGWWCCLFMFVLGWWFFWSVWMLWPCEHYLCLVLLSDSMAAEMYSLQTIVDLLDFVDVFVTGREGPHVNLPMVRPLRWDGYILSCYTDIKNCKVLIQIRITLATLDSNPAGTTTSMISTTLPTFTPWC